MIAGLNVYESETGCSQYRTLIISRLKMYTVKTIQFQSLTKTLTTIKYIWYIIMLCQFKLSFRNNKFAADQRQVFAYEDLSKLRGLFAWGDQYINSHWI
jgi:hypothetical protein